MIGFKAFCCFYKNYDLFFLLFPPIPKGAILGPALIFFAAISTSFSTITSSAAACALFGFLKGTNLSLQTPEASLTKQVVIPTVEADVAFGLGRLNLTNSEVRSRVSKALDAVGMPVQALRGGQKKRVAIAGALAEACKVLLLDELTTFLDESDQMGLVKAVQNLLNIYGEVTAL
ncbi:ABC transporter I family member 10, chloroplastic [Gossypium arboreum]|uniref:ABC transporter I family member 10, chloroplastic n=1 Tax=Gossypium arboreum TaxID=29729 RepID=A0A0B0MYT0_GOSAR|nr:ABC transporter I family member 10, chloroplastic [Gossypium arboreum]